MVEWICIEKTLIFELTPKGAILEGQTQMAVAIRVQKCRFVTVRPLHPRASFLCFVLEAPASLTFKYVCYNLSGGVKTYELNKKPFPLCYLGLTAKVMQLSYVVLCLARVYSESCHSLVVVLPHGPTMVSWLINGLDSSYARP